MPMTTKGKKIISAMEKTYGKDRAKKIFYASKNSGKITGVDKGFYGHKNPHAILKGSSQIKHTAFGKMDNDRDSD